MALVKQSWSLTNRRAVPRFGLITIEDIEKAGDDALATNFDGIPPDLEIKANEIKLHCIDGKPIELDQGGNGAVLYGKYQFSLVLASQLPERHGRRRCPSPISCVANASSLQIMPYKCCCPLCCLHSYQFVVMK